MNEFCHLLPKAELHAHINGSISRKTLEKLMGMKRKRCPDFEPPNLDNLFSTGHNCRNIDRIFKNVFPVIHQVVDNDEAVYTATCDVISDFVEDHVKYLELRTTPKSNPASKMTYSSYVTSVLKAIDDNKHSDIIVRLLLSIDRSQSVKVAQETLALARKLYSENGIVAGIDLCGDPKFDETPFLPLLQNAKSQGLRLALHLGEVPGAEKNLQHLLNLPPDRIGHGTFLHEEPEVVSEQVRQLQVPFELCLTSNLLSETVKSYKEHHWTVWYGKNPVVLCTDDKGVFETSLSREFEIAAHTFGLNRDQLGRLARTGFEHAFLNDHEKQQLIRKYFSCL